MKGIVIKQQTIKGIIPHIVIMPETEVEITKPEYEMFGKKMVNVMCHDLPAPNHFYIPAKDVKIMEDTA